MPKISIIVPVYKSEDYLPACLDSVLAQTLTDFELICVNDGSPDNCGVILDQYAQKDARIHVITQKNQGQAVARNVALDKATGDYIFFLDSDDRLASYALDTFYRVAQESGCPVVVSRMICAIEQPQSRALWHKHVRVLDDFVHDRRIFSPVWNKLYRREVLANHRFIPGIYFEDWPFLLQVFGDLDSYASIESPCYIYNEGNSSTTRSRFTAHKIDSYVCGIRFVYETYVSRSVLPLIRYRINIAVKMMVGKVYKAKDKDLDIYLLKRLDDLFLNRVVLKYTLPIKTRYRLWKIRYRSK